MKMPGKATVFTYVMCFVLGVSVSRLMKNLFGSSLEVAVSSLCCCLILGTVVSWFMNPQA